MANGCNGVRIALRAEQTGRKPRADPLSVTMATGIQLHHGTQVVDFGTQVKTCDSPFAGRKRPSLATMVREMASIHQNLRFFPPPASYITFTLMGGITFLLG